MPVKDISMYYVQSLDCTIIIMNRMLWKLTEYLDSAHELSFKDIKKTDTLIGNKAYLAKTSTDKNYRISIRDKKNGKSHRPFSSYETVKKCSPGYECFCCKYPDCVYGGKETAEEKQIYKNGHYMKEGVSYGSI